MNFDLSQALSIQLAINQSDNMTTRRTVPGQIVIKVFITKRVLNVIRFNAPMLRDDASENRRLCNNITTATTTKYKNKLERSSEQNCTKRVLDVTVISDRTVD